MAEKEVKPDTPIVPRRRRDWGLLTLVCLAAITAVAGFGMLFSIWLQSQPPDKQQTLSLALERYIVGQRIVASKLAEHLELDPNLEAEANLIPLRDFLIGAGRVARAAEETNGSQRRRLLYEAIPYLQTAANRGFPSGRQAEGFRLLGDSLYALGRFDDAIDPYRSAVETDRTLHRQLAPRLAESLLKSNRREAEEALKLVDAYRDDISLSSSQRREAELIRIETLIMLRRWDEAAAAIEQSVRSIGPVPDASPAEGTISQVHDFRDRLRLLRAEMQINRIAGEGNGLAPQVTLSPAVSLPAIPGRDPTEQLSTVIAGLHALKLEASVRIASRARLLLARAHFLQGEPDQALVELTHVRQQRPISGEAVAAGLIEIELLADRSQGAEAVHAARYLVSELGDPRGYDGSLVPFHEFERRLVAAIEKLQQQGAYENAIDLARIVPPVFGATEALLQEGTAYREWADRTLDEARRQGREVSPRVAAIARGRYRAAGDAFAAAADLEFTSPRYVPTLWAAIEAYQQGKHFRRSLTLLEPYLRFEDRQRQPRGLLASGRALLAEGDTVSLRRAIATLEECVTEYPRDPLRYEARLLAAHALSELGELDDARALLEQNLRDGLLAPSSPVWQDSLLTLGELLYQRVHENQLLADHAVDQERRRLMSESRHLIDDALRYLNEAVERSWPQTESRSQPSRRSLHAAYLAARTHRIAARLPIMEADSSEATNVDRRRSRLASTNELRASLDRYTRLRAHLESQLDENQVEGRLPPFELAMLRNCLIGEADTLYEMNLLEDAAAAYGSVTLRFMNEPLALEGIMGHAECLRRMDRIREADSRVQQASQVLRRIPNEWNDRFQEITRYSRAEWDRLLTWMNDRIRARGV